MNESQATIDEVGWVILAVGILTAVIVGSVFALALFRSRPARAREDLVGSAEPAAWVPPTLQRRIGCSLGWIRVDYPLVQLTIAPHAFRVDSLGIHQLVQRSAVICIRYVSFPLRSRVKVVHTSGRNMPLQMWGGTKGIIDDFARAGWPVCEPPPHWRREPPSPRSSWPSA